jgi:5,10-methenyltetrahydromethanopterin hydrogenase
MQAGFEQIKPQVAANLETAREVADLAISQIERATELALELGKQNNAFAQGQASAVVDLKDPAAVFQFVQDQLKASASHAAAVAQEAYELGQVFQAELSGFAETHFDSAHAEANKLVAQALKNAPQGSEAAVAAVKQAVEASNKAVTEARKAVKQSADIAKENFDKLKAQAPVAKKAARRR